MFRTSAHDFKFEEGIKLIYYRLVGYPAAPSCLLGIRDASTRGGYGASKRRCNLCTSTHLVNERINSDPNYFQSYCIVRINEYKCNL